MILNRKWVTSGIATASLLVLGTAASADTLFWDQMNSNSAGSWSKNATADTLATFGFDYSTVGIPEAPNSMPGDDATSGLKLEANIANPGTNDQQSLFPTGQSFSGFYKLSFDAWMNYDVEELLQGEATGTTEFIGGGIGYNGTSTDIGSGAQAVATGDGGSGSDYRVFKSNTSTLFIPAADMSGGTRNNADPYYATFLPGVAPPAAQGQAALAGPAGTTGFQWLTWHFGVQDDIVRIALEKPDGTTKMLATLDCSDTADGSTGCTTSGNVMLFYADFFTSVSPRPIWTYGVIDNVHVESIPEPTSLLLLALSATGLMAGARRR